VNRSARPVDVAPRLDAVDLVEAAARAKCGADDALEA